MVDQSVDDIQGVFSLLDQNGDGKISVEELEAKMDMTKTEIRNLIDQEDVDENGTLELYEFLAMVQKKAESKEPKNVETQVREAFLFWDNDSDGFLSSDELRKIIPSYDDVYEIIKQQDIDGDGRINYDEFALVMNSVVVPHVKK